MARKDQPRRYRMTEHGEVPIWPRKSTLQRMAREDAQRHFQFAGTPSGGAGNLVYDEEYRAEWERLTQSK